MLPAVALGGFLASGEPLTKAARYHEAKALIVTFLVNNKNDKNQVRTLHPTVLFHIYMVYKNLTKRGLKETFGEKQILYWYILHYAENPSGRNIKNIFT